MEKRYLPLSFNIPAARVFLNLFGLTLENVEEVQVDSKVKVFYKDEKVGELIFFDGKVFIVAEFNGYKLRADYPLSTFFGFQDIETDNALFFDFRNDIRFKIEKDDTLIEGTIMLDCTLDSGMGNHCHCLPEIKFKDKDREIDLKMRKDGEIFRLEINSLNVSEIIKINSHLIGDNGASCHYIDIGEYDKEKFGRPYEFVAGIISSKDGQEVNFRIKKNGEYIENNGKYTHILTEMVPYAGTTEEEISIQRGLLMQQLDPSAFRKINELRENLLIGNEHILNNLFSTCFSHYPDTGFKASFGFERPKMIFQDGTDTLMDTYLKPQIPKVKDFQKKLGSQI